MIDGSQLLDGLDIFRVQLLPFGTDVLLLAKAACEHKGIEQLEGVAGERKVLLDFFSSLLAPDKPG